MSVSVAPRFCADVLRLLHGRRYGAATRATSCMNSAGNGRRALPGEPPADVAEGHGAGRPMLTTVRRGVPAPTRLRPIARREPQNPFLCSFCSIVG